MLFRSEATYNLEIRYRIGEVCIGDQRELVNGGVRESEVMICAGAEHQYCFSHAGGALGAHVRNDFGGDVALKLRTVAGQPMAVVDDSPTTECLYQADLDAGDYCVVVEGVLDSTYDLTVDQAECL